MPLQSAMLSAGAVTAAGRVLEVSGQGRSHPGWPILHPLVAESRTAVLWPNPTAIDFAALIEVCPAEFRFDTLTYSQKTTEDTYQRWTAEHPLAEGISPMISE